VGLPSRPSADGRDGFDETGLELRQHHVAAGNKDGPDDDQDGKQTKQYRQTRAARLYAEQVESLHNESVSPTGAGVRRGNDRQEWYQEEETDTVERRGNYRKRRRPDAVEAANAA
jgi:hypothetical protein